MDFTYGVLFHPERSGAVGLRIPANFIDLLLSWASPGKSFPPRVSPHTAHAATRQDVHYPGDPR
ncbi:MAG TPA: hypothetical protein PKK74_01295 [Candidatus Methanoculleus thermohydrogenotrophicum]|nr:hypothetical protein [Candidatus Methanoculleus thermohydrogenotrophicum]NLM81213.1 hypothetical protein [Candidatus Methanoculleus thermohydrogenotrophicum]HOB17320.1 hypothetical protein [Candidatus Methanoculleus thermohydrogenotrophicum]HPZ37475.1 hypothetical protein [Candidatus Methanoculleus thermohydrogenotrophicum]HQC90927.1 hypothetical protein [Candidatus Methanoculleus thermohydrogenotrophicum]